MKQYLLLFLCLTCLFYWDVGLPITSVHAQDKSLTVVTSGEFPHWRFWDTQNGLIDNWVNAINVDPWGNLMFAQEKQSIIFDGYKFNLTPSSSRKDRLFKNVDGQLWSPNFVGLEIMVDDEYVSHDLREYFPEYKEKFPFRRFLIASSFENEFYIISPNQLITYNAETQTAEILLTQEDTPLQNFESIESNYNGSIWVIANNGVIQISATQKYSPHDFQHTVHMLPTGFESATILDVFVYPDGSLCVITDSLNQRSILSLQNGKWQTLYTGNFVTGWLGHDNGFWVVNQHEETNEMLLQYHIQNKIYEMKPNRFTRRFFDIRIESKNQFFLASQNGIAMFTVPLWRPDETLPSQEKNIKSSIAESGTRHWYLAGEELLLNDNGNWTVTDIPPNPNRGFYQRDSLRMMNNKNVLIFASNLVMIFDPSTGTFKNYYHRDYQNNLFIPVFEWLENETLLFGTRYYKDRFVIERYDFTSYDTLFDFKESNWDNNIHDIIQHTNGTIWFATTKSLYWFDENRLSTPTTIPEDKLGNIYHLYETKNRNVIIVSDDIYKYQNQQFTTLVENNSQFDRLGYIQEDQNQTLWFTANNGIHRYQEGTFLTNTVDDGLFDDTFNSIQIADNGVAYAGGELGLRIYDSAKDQDPPNTIINVNQNFNEFTHNTPIRFEVTGNDRWEFTRPERLLYSYKISEDDWSPFQSNTTLNIPARSTGNHTLFVRSMDRNFNIDPTPAEYTFTINPPWYLEPAFLIWSTLASVVTLLFAFAAVRNYRHLNVSLIETKQTIAILEQTKEDLIRSKAKAESATKAKDSFLARMSHEIRTPLNGIVGNLELLSIVKSEEQKSDLIRLSNLSAQTLQGIIGDVLDFAKIEADLFELDNVEISLHSIFEEVFSMLCVRANQKQLRMTADWDSNIPTKVSSDPVRIRQVFINLINNSIKFTEHGGVFIRMKCVSKTETQANILIEILDTGSGFDSSKKSDLFKEFVQDESSKKMSEGTGLGLPICQRIVKLMGGTIECEGYIDAGARFWFTIPFTIIEDSAPNQNITVNPRILMILQEKTGLESTVTNTLAKNNCSWETANSIDQITNGSSYDFVLLFDNTNLNQTVSKLRDSQPSETKCILITSNQDPRIKFEVMRQDFHFVFQNKVAQDDLIHLLSSEGQMTQLANENLEKRININEILETVSIPGTVKPVLVIDDVKTNQLLTKTQLKQLNVKCDITSNGIEALEKVAQNDYSMIFVDCSMPEMDGFEFTKRYRLLESETGSHKPVIAMTAHVLTGIRERCLEAGMDDYISKPVRLEVLVNILHDWLLKESN